MFNSDTLFVFSSQASGATVDPAVMDALTTIKLAKKDDERVRFLTFGFSNDKIVVKKTIHQKDLKGENPFCYLKREFLKDEECCYILYDCHYETTECPKEDLVFMMW